MSGSTLWHSRSLEAVLTELKVEPAHGLSDKVVRERQKQYGLNVLPRGPHLNLWRILGRQFRNPLILILLGAGVITLLLGEHENSWAIFLAVAVNTAIGFWQEYRSNKIFEKLDQLVQATARVRRGGQIYEIDRSGVVVGDIILLAASLKVPADARLIKVHNLSVNESLLTGESVAVDKEPGTLESAEVLADRSNMVHMGTVVERGGGEAVVVAIGENTELGRIAALTSGIREEETPLQARLKRLGRLIAGLVLVLVAVIFAFGLAQGRPATEMLILAVAVAVAAVPEGLPAALSVVLAISATRILKKGGLVRKLVGAETLGSTSVIVTDKTGTLTTGIMKLEHLLSVTSPPNGRAGKSEALIILALANDAVIVRDADDTLQVRGEATDRAKLDYFVREDGDLSELELRLSKIAHLSFDEHRRYIAAFRQSPEGLGVFVSGAPEVVLKHSKLEPHKRHELLMEAAQWAAKGYRVIALASNYHRGATSATCHDHQCLEKMVSNLNFVGLAAFRDPIRAEVKAALAEAAAAHVRVIMATGDHKDTAVAIGHELGFATRAENILTGDEIDALSDQELDQKIKHIAICARVSPAHKLRLVDALQRAGEVVAMTGDGINDAPALAAADIGVAIGSGAEVTKEASDLVLVHDSFSIITSAIREGRIAFDNMRKVSVFLLSKSFTEILLIIAALALNTAFLPLLAIQILWANIVQDSLPNFALAFEPGERGVMHRHPLPRREAIIDRQGLTIIFIVGILADLMLVGLFFYLSLATTLAPAYIQTLIFALLIANSLLIIFPIKSYRNSLFRSRLFDNYYLLLAILIGFFLLLAAIYWAPLATWLGTVPLTPRALGLVFLSALAQLLLVEVIKWLFRWKTKNS